MNAHTEYDMKQFLNKFHNLSQTFWSKNFYNPAHPLVLASQTTNKRHALVYCLQGNQQWRRVSVLNRLI